jgi:hypothetical protein
MTKTVSPRRQTKVLQTVDHLLRAWCEKHQTLQVEIGIGVVTQVCYGTLDELAPGNFLVHLKGLRSLLVLDDEWKRHAKLALQGGKHHHR